MLCRACVISRSLPVCSNASITERLVLVLSTRARHVAGMLPLPGLHSGPGHRMPELPRQPRIVLQRININLSSQVSRLPLADDMPFGWPFCVSKRASRHERAVSGNNGHCWNCSGHSVNPSACLAQYEHFKV